MAEVIDDSARVAVPFSGPPLRENLLRLPQVLKRFPVSKSTWWVGVSRGDYPAGIKLSVRTTAWRESDIDALIAKHSGTNNGA